MLPLVPRTGAIRQERAAWGQPQEALTLVVEKPGRTKTAASRRGHGRSGQRHGEVESPDGRVTHEALRVVVVHSSPLAQQHAPAYTAAQWSPS